MGHELARDLDTVKVPAEASLATQSIAKVLPFKRRVNRAHLAYVDYSQDACDIGFLVHRDTSRPPMVVERTAANSHLFLLNSAADNGPRFELNYRHSAAIVSELTAFQPSDRQPQPRPLVLFDIDGNAYNHAVQASELQAETYQNGSVHEKHTAHFKIEQTPALAAPEFAIPIDAIFTQSIAAPPYLWEGDNS